MFEVDLPIALADAFEAAATARGITPGDLMDHVLERSIAEFVGIATAIVPPPAQFGREHPNCACCSRNHCAKAFRWRGLVRCGCPAAERDRRKHDLAVRHEAALDVSPAA